MDIPNIKKRLEQAANSGSNSISFGGPLDSMDSLVSAPEPLFGAVSWSPPESYRDWMTEVGPFSLGWYSPSCESIMEVGLLGPEGIEETSEIVYMPEDVSFQPDVYVSTNHLMPFASAGYEAAFCFDVRQAGDYSIYYHHQDEGRVVVTSSGEWHGGTPAKPDFKNFEAWLTWLVVTLELQTDPEAVGLPTSHFLFMIE